MLNPQIWMDNNPKHFFLVTQILSLMELTCFPDCVQTPVTWLSPLLSLSSLGNRRDQGPGREHVFLLSVCPVPAQALEVSWGPGNVEQKLK